MNTIPPEDYSWTIERRLTEDLRDLIIAGDLEPGTRLQYRPLAARFRVSITPVRAALRDLAKEGLVEIKPNVGAHVTALSRDELEEIYLARIAYEHWLTHLGVPRLTNEQIHRMSEVLIELDNVVQLRQMDATLDTGWRLREACYEIASRPKVLMTAQSLFKRAGRYNRRTLAREERFDETQETSHAFYEACVLRDPIGAADAVRLALQRSLIDIGRQLDSEQGGEGPHFSADPWPG